MTRRTMIGCLATAAILASVLASTGSAQQPTGRTFTLIEHDDSQAFGDVAPRSSNQQNPRLSGGDMHVFTSKLFDEENHNVGRVFAQCITVRGGRVVGQFESSSPAISRSVQT